MSKLQILGQRDLVTSGVYLGQGAVDREKQYNKFYKFDSNGVPTASVFKTYTSSGRNTLSVDPTYPVFSPFMSGIAVDNDCAYTISNRGERIITAYNRRNFTNDFNNGRGQMNYNRSSQLTKYIYWNRSTAFLGIADKFVSAPVYDLTAIRAGLQSATGSDFYIHRGIRTVYALDVKTINNKEYLVVYVGSGAEGWLIVQSISSWPSLTGGYESSAADASTFPMPFAGVTSRYTEMYSALTAPPFLGDSRFEYRIQKFVQTYTPISNAIYNNPQFNRDIAFGTTDLYILDINTIRKVPITSVVDATATRYDQANTLYGGGSPLTKSPSTIANITDTNIISVMNTAMETFFGVEVTYHYRGISIVDTTMYILVTNVNTNKSYIFLYDLNTNTVGDYYDLGTNEDLYYGLAALNNGTKLYSRRGDNNRNYFEAHAIQEIDIDNSNSANPCHNIEVNEEESSQESAGNIIDLDMTDGKLWSLENIQANQLTNIQNFNRNLLQNAVSAGDSSNVSAPDSYYAPLHHYQKVDILNLTRRRIDINEYNLTSELNTEYNLYTLNTNINRLPTGFELYSNICKELPSNVETSGYGSPSGYYQVSNSDMIHAMFSKIYGCNFRRNSEGINKAFPVNALVRLSNNASVNIHEFESCGVKTNSHYSTNASTIYDAIFVNPHTGKFEQWYRNFKIREGDLIDDLSLIEDNLLIAAPTTHAQYTAPTDNYRKAIPTDSHYSSYLPTAPDDRIVNPVLNPNDEDDINRWLKVQRFNQHCLYYWKVQNGEIYRSDISGLTKHSVGQGFAYTTFYDDLYCGGFPCGKDSYNPFAGNLEKFRFYSGIASGISNVLFIAYSRILNLCGVTQSTRVKIPNGATIATRLRLTKHLKHNVGMRYSQIIDRDDDTVLEGGFSGCGYASGTAQTNAYCNANRRKPPRFHEQALGVFCSNQSHRLISCILYDPDRNIVEQWVYDPTVSKGDTIV